MTLQRSGGAACPRVEIPLGRMPWKPPVTAWAGLGAGGAGTAAASAPVALPPFFSPTLTRGQASAASCLDGELTLGTGEDSA